ncbi:MAG: thiamine pyrophosphate-dependent dehydrogenase E1 component subunit alpha, partial [Bacteroidota bacterium]|nr:thiamine pyrophosphate-dependent dehydrogenase E1 component subunit alpha [Bacteroidota bacterium]
EVVQFMRELKTKPCLDCGNSFPPECMDFDHVRGEKYGNVSHLGAMVPVAVGAALAQKLSKSGFVVLNYIGDGGASVGEVHEGLMMASVQQLPFVLVIENNQYAYSTPVAAQTHNPRFSDRAIGYGIPGVTVDGTDIEAVFSATSQAIEFARAGNGPTIIETTTMRMRGHAEHDPFDYVPKELLEEWDRKDPVLRTATLLLNKGASESELTSMQQQAKSEIEEAVAYANTLPAPDAAEAFKNVFFQ